MYLLSLEKNESISFHSECCSADNAVRGTKYDLSMAENAEIGLNYL